MAPKVFSLHNKQLKLTTAEEIEPYVKPLLEDTTYTEVHLGGNTFGVEACERLATVLATQKNLEVADLADIFTNRSVEEIPKAMRALVNALLEIPTLHTVDFSDNAFGERTKDPLVDFLSRAVPLRHLILHNNGLGPVAGKDVAKALTTLAKRKEEARKEGKDVPPLESIVCGRNRLENGSMAAWANAYKAHAKGIRSVKMTQNGIKAAGIKHLLNKGLSYLTALEVLDLQDNTFTKKKEIEDQDKVIYVYKGATALAGVIQGWTSLRELGVGDCLLHNKGAEKVAKALAGGKNQKVEILRLQYNDINADGVQEFLSAIKKALPALRRIELNGNKFAEDDDNVEELSNLLENRKEEHGSHEDPEDSWGIDELDELEEEEEEEEEEIYEEYDDDNEDLEEEEEEKEEREHLEDKILEEAVRAEGELVSQKKDSDVDALADTLKKTSL